MSDLGLGDRIIYEPARYAALRWHGLLPGPVGPAPRLPGRSARRSFVHDIRLLAHARRLLAAVPIVIADPVVDGTFPAESGTLPEHC